METIFTVVAPLSRTCGCITPVFDGASASIYLFHIVSVELKAGTKM